MTIMDDYSYNVSLSNDDDKNLEFLLEAFGSQLSADDMASAYCEAGHDLLRASEILYAMLGSSSNNDIPILTNYQTTAPLSSAGLVGSTGSGVNGAGVNGTGVNGAGYPRPGTIINEPRKSASRYRPKNSGYARSGGTVANEPSKAVSRSKPKNSGVSLGTISGIIGADYGRTRALTKEARESTKPVKLMSDEFPVSQIWEEKPQPVKETSKSMNEDIEKFLIQMLGEGFQLDMEVIREVVGGCGYDVHESVETLLNMSASTLKMGDTTSSMVDIRNSKDTYQDLSNNFEEKLQLKDSAQRNRLNLEKEVLGNLFTVPERCELGPRTILPRLELRTRKFGYVAGPLEDNVVFKTPIVQKEVNGDEEIEDNYETLREAAAEHWQTMKKYYKAAADAYTRGSRDLADKFVEEGHFYMAKAREANDISAKMLSETRSDGEAISINLNGYDPKEAIRLLKTQLKMMGGIPSIHYLKVFVGTTDDKTKPSARKRLITKLLDREQITWTEEQEGQVMTIRMDVINPSRLSFNKN